MGQVASVEQYHTNDFCESLYIIIYIILAHRGFLVKKKAPSTHISNGHKCPSTDCSCPACQRAPEAEGQLEAQEGHPTCGVREKVLTLDDVLVAGCDSHSGYPPLPKNQKKMPKDRGGCFDKGGKLH